MALTLWDASNVNDTIEGWVQTETTDHAIKVGTAEAQKELSVLSLCEEVPPFDAKDPPEKANASGLASGSKQEDTLVPDDDISEEDEVNIHQPSGSEVEDIATKMLALAAEIKRFGKAYEVSYTHLTNAVAKMRQVHRLTAPVVARGRTPKILNFFKAKETSQTD